MKKMKGKLPANINNKFQSQSVMSIKKNHSSDNMPPLRFPEFKGDWERKKLGELAEINPINKTLPNKFIYIDLESVFNGELLKENEITSENAPSRAQRVLEVDDVLFQMVRPYQKNNLFFDKSGAYVASTGYAQIRTKQNPKYLFQYLHFQSFVDKVIERCTGTSYPSINSTDLSNIEFSFPTLPEQTKIASFLTAVDAKLQALKKKQSLLEEYKKGVMQRIFLNYDESLNYDVNDTDYENYDDGDENSRKSKSVKARQKNHSSRLRFKDENGKDFPEWEVKKLGEIGTFFSGGTPLTSKREYFNGKIPFIRSGEINSNTTEQFISEEGLKNSSSKMVEKGDLLYALYGATSGEVGISKIKGAINQAILCIRTNLDNSFLHNYLLMEKENIIKTYLQGGQGNLSADIIKSLQIPVPSIAEQTRIANFLSAIDEKISQTHTQITQTESWKKGLLQRMFC